MNSYGSYEAVTKVTFLRLSNRMCCGATPQTPKTKEKTKTQRTLEYEADNPKNQ